MLTEYKSIFFIYIITIIAGCFGLLMAIDNTEQGIFIAACITVGVWSAGCTLFFQVMATRKYNKNVTLLFDNCRIRDFIAENEKLLAKNHDRANRNVLRFNLFAGYYQLGNMEQAKQVLFKIKPNFGTTLRGILYSRIYYSHLAELYISSCDFEQAKQVIDSLQSILINSATNESQHAVISRNIENINMLLDLKQNNYDGTKKYFALRLSLEPSLLNKVVASYHLANICLHYNETEEAIEHLNFVIENGGDTYYVSNANEILHQITENK